MRDPFLKELEKRHFAEISISVMYVITKIGGQKMSQHLDFFLKPFKRHYQCIDELIEYKLDKRIAEERQEVIHERS